MFCGSLPEIFPIKYTVLYRGTSAKLKSYLSACDAVQSGRILMMLIENVHFKGQRRRQGE
jgi:hypothetical protein